MGESMTSTIPPEHVRLGVEREVRSLADLGFTGAEAERRAIAITAGLIGNSALLAERQEHDGRCHACNGPLDDTRPVVAVLSGRQKAHLFLHAGACHDAYRDRRAVLVARIMAAAGYGAEMTGAAA